MGKCCCVLSRNEEKKIREEVIKKLSQIEGMSLNETNADKYSTVMLQRLLQKSLQENTHKKKSIF